MARYFLDIEEGGHFIRETSGGSDGRDPTEGIALYELTDLITELRARLDATG